MEVTQMNKKETSVTEWVKAFKNGSSFWKNSVHVDEFLGKKQNKEIYFSKSFALLQELIERMNEVGLAKNYHICLSFYLNPSTRMEVSTPNIYQLWNEFSHTPPELCLIEKPIVSDRGTVECYEKPIPLDQIDKDNILKAYQENMFSYYSCWLSGDSEEGDQAEYQRIILIEYRSH
jgi:hypothetical protein